jgi:hypothetical protein
VARRARPSAKEWAEATAREMELIESDWSALVWALGSLRILSEPCFASPIASLAQVPQAALEFTRVIRRRTVMGSASCGFLVIYFSWFAWHPMFGLHSHHHLMLRIGAYLTAAATLYMIGQLLVRRGRLPSKGSPATAGEYRTELGRQRDFHRGIWLWSRICLMTPGYLLFCKALPVANAVGVVLKLSIFFAFLSLCVVAVPLNLRLARQYQRRMDELDAMEQAV